MSRIWVFMVLLLWGCGRAEPDRRPLTVAAAASFQYVLPELAEAFTAATGTECRFVFGSSGKLTAQWRAGAPYDVLLSADLEYPAALVSDGLTAGGIEVFARGKLVLFVSFPTFHNGEGGKEARADRPSSTDLRMLDTLAFNRLALPNPAVAPYGRAARAALEATGRWATVEERIVYGESVGQVNQYLSTGNAEFGFTTAAAAPPLRDLGRLIPVDTGLYRPIDHGAVRRAGSGTEAQAFLDFLRSPEAREILATFGYGFP